MKRTGHCAAFALFFVFALSAVNPERLFADERSHRKLAEEFMVLADTAKMMTSSLDQVKAKQLERLDEVAYPGKDPEKDQNLKKRVADYLDKKLVWSHFREGYIAIYAEVFTEEELKALVDFYSSPVGRKVQSNSQDLRVKLLQSTQMQLKGVTFDIKKIEKDFVAEQKKQEN